MKFLMFVVVAIIVHSSVFISKGNATIVGVICNTDIGTFSCSDTTVIDIRMARFGRDIPTPAKVMCGKETTVNSTCFDDVTEVICNNCTGRHNCTLQVNQRNFLNTGTCPKGSRKYLEVQYQCVSPKGNEEGRAQTLIPSGTSYPIQTSSTPAATEDSTPQLWVYIVVVLAAIFVVMLVIALFCLRKKKNRKWSSNLHFKKTNQQTNNDEYRQQLTNNNLSSKSQEPRTNSGEKCTVVNELYVPLESAQGQRNEQSVTNELYVPLELAEGQRNEQSAYSLAVDPVEAPYSVLDNSVTETSEYSVLASR